MSHFSICERLRTQAVTLSMLVAVLGLTSEAAASIYDFNVANGNYNNGANWVNHADNSTGVVPQDANFAIVRNGGTLNLTAADGNVTAYLIRVGAGPQTAVDPVVPDVDPPAPPLYGGSGTLNWTGGDIVGYSSAGPRLTLGFRDNATDTTFTGIVNHSGGKISLNTNSSFLVIGASGATPTPTSVYNLSGNGVIGVVTGAGSNDGINIRNGTFNMTGGSIVADGGILDQRAITMGTGSGGSLGNENTSYANFSGGTVDVNNGMRIATQTHNKSYVTISGTASLLFRGADVSLGRNATNSYAQVDMSGGSLSLGYLPEDKRVRLIIGDAGTGVFNLSGGTVNLHNSFVVGNNNTSKGTFYQTGGTLTVNSVELNRNSGIWDLNTENATVIIDGPSAVFTQQNSPDIPALTGQTTIGQFGKGRFEVRQGQANLREVRLSQNSTSRATLAVTGGILRIQDGVFRNNITSVAAPGDFNNNGVVDTADYVVWKKNQNTNNALANDNGLGTPVGTAHYDLWRANFGNLKQDNTPTVTLTGGELELTPSISAMSWQTNMSLQGTKFDPKPGAVMLTNVGSYPNRPGNFSLNAGSVWDVNIASNTLFGGADWVDVPNSCNLATACDVTPGATFAPSAFNGGTINIIPISGYTPAFGDTVTILQNSLGGVTLSAGAVTVSNPNWVLQKNPANTTVQLRYVGPGSGSSLTGSAVPEPSTILFAALFGSFSLASRRARYSKRYGASCIVGSHL